MQNSTEDRLMNDIYKYLEVDSPSKLIDVINERMKEFGISQYQMGKLLSINKSTFNRLIENIENGDIEKVDFYSILKIAQFMNIGIEKISQFYVSSMKPELIGELENIRKANFLHKHFDLKALKEIGFIDDLYDIKSIESRITNFFELSNIFEYQARSGAVLFSSTKRSNQNKMKDFWIRSAYCQFQKIQNENDFDVDKLKALVPKIKGYTRYEEKGLLTVCQALYQIGITVIGQKCLPKTHVRGGCFIVNNKPCIIITDYNNSYATIWFALMHELYHVIYDFEELKTTWKYHLTGEPDINLFSEDNADYFARELLFSEEKLNYIQHLISSHAVVVDYAKQNNVHPSIVYHFYCYHQQQKGKNKYGLYQQFFGTPEKALQQLRVDIFNPSNRTICNGMEQIKNILEGKVK